MSKEGASRAWAVMGSSDGWNIRVVRPDGTPASADARLGELDERALVRAAAAGSRDAFDVLVERYRRQVYQICYRFTGNHEDASDLAQDAFVRAWRGIGRFKAEAALATWLYRITVNVCLSRAARQSYTHTPLDPDQLAHAGTDQGRQLLQNERARAVRRAILGLPRKQRATLILRTYHDLSHRQIAEILGSSVGAVKANFFHALGNLKRILGREP